MAILQIFVATLALAFAVLLAVVKHGVLPASAFPSFTSMLTYSAVPAGIVTVVLVVTAAARDVSTFTGNRHRPKDDRDTDR